MIYVNVNLHANFHPHTSRASPSPVNALQSFWGSLVDGFFYGLTIMASVSPFMGPACLPVSIALPMPHRMGSLISEIREVLQDAPKASNLRKPELCWFCTETDGMDRSVSLSHSRSLSSRKLSLCLGISQGPLYFLWGTPRPFIASAVCHLFLQGEGKPVHGSPDTLNPSFLPFSLSWLLIKWKVFSRWQNKTCLPHWWRRAGV